jgi:dTDP-L-rhamnose 4-epimerase
MASHNILITGGAGFIGSNLALKLIERGYEVTVLDNLSPQVHGLNPEITSPIYSSIKGKVNFIQGSVTQRGDWNKALDGQDAVIHLAAETGTGQSMYEIQRYANVNVGGTALMLDILTNEKHTIEKVVVASSRAVYGEGMYRCQEHGIVYPEARHDDDMMSGDFDCKCPQCKRGVELLPTSEESKVHPTSVYGISKYTQEQLVLNVGTSIGLPAVAFRYQNVYGPGQSLTNPYTGILSIFSTRIKNHAGINIFEDGKESRDFVYIDDAVTATIMGIENDAANFNVFNVGSGVPIEVLSVAKSLCKHYKRDEDISVSGNYRLGDIRHNYADLKTIKRIIGYEPHWTFENGIEAFCAWVDQQDIQNDNYLQSLSEMKQKHLFKT